MRQQVAKKREFFGMSCQAMAAPGISRLPLTRTVKKVEKPRPLKNSQSMKSGVESPRLNDDVMKLADVVVSQLRSNDRTDIVQNIMSLASHLKLYGQQLEGVYGDQFDRTFTALRNFAKDENFDILTRLRLLELIELRAMRWTTTDDAIAYYQHKLGKVEAELSPVDALSSGLSTPTSSGLPFPFHHSSAPYISSPVGTTSPPAVPLLGPGEVIKPSGKYALPTKVPGKSYLKDEVVIRNADSGKVMGIKGRRVHMIEELSETIISFQRVSPGAKERLVQITGPSEERIDYARQLIEETIRRNASPSRPEETAVRPGTGAMGSNSSLNSSASDEIVRPQRLSDGVRIGARRTNSLLHSLSTNDASVGEYKYTVTVGTSSLRITGPDLKLVRAAKLVLDEYFSKANWQNWGPGDDINMIEEDHLFFSESENNSTLEVFDAELFKRQSVDIIVCTDADSTDAE
ncbi:hypothetical protein B566_EDAN015243 [Ephemera danica]|nr:hypothetical protein B566_EDAN015243 [Ephemera danica]